MESQKIKYKATPSKQDSSLSEKQSSEKERKKNSHFTSNNNQPIDRQICMTLTFGGNLSMTAIHFDNYK